MERSLPLWHELQEHAGTKLMHRTGGVNIERLCEKSGSAAGLSELRDLYARRGIEHEMMSAAELNARFPQVRLEHCCGVLLLLMCDAL